MERVHKQLFSTIIIRQAMIDNLQPAVEEDTALHMILGSEHKEKNSLMHDSDFKTENSDAS